ncbi:LysR family transcriptional regulator [Streptomyces sp. LX-29]|uniref:LysR family transcriptional regulator n=1 Tax=Streptomyces sp. LX-29 TaxID=2900152 RepID=UPI00240CFB6F|nr:LysR family transcriptional regulator [Streptomyces sp. LX-29]WFB10691.1 LysR family transcriptional regulator [Streptomyces sp. LX-29]
MDLHLLRTFLTVARLGSFSAAARDLGYTQSAVSQHIAALEADLGAPVLERRPVVPTAVGARLLEHAGPLLLRAEAARADIARMTTRPTARVAIGRTPLAAAEELATALAGARRAVPGLLVQVRVLSGAALPAAVATGEVDLALVDGVAAPNDPLHLPDTSPLAAAGVGERPLAVVLPRDHPLAGRARLRLTDLADAVWLDAPDLMPTPDQLCAITGADGFRARVRYEGADPHGLLALVAAGHGLALLPADAVDRAPGLAAVPLAAPRLVHRTELLHSRGLDGPGGLIAARLTGTDPDRAPTG